MANDVAMRARTAYPVKNGCAVVWQKGPGLTSKPLYGTQYEEKADILDADVDRWRSTGRNRLYYTTGEPDPADPV